MWFCRLRILRALDDARLHLLYVCIVLDSWFWRLCTHVGSGATFHHGFRASGRRHVLSDGAAVCASAHPHRRFDDQEDAWHNRGPGEADRHGAHRIHSKVRAHRTRSTTYHRSGCRHILPVQWVCACRRGLRRVRCHEHHWLWARCASITAGQIDHDLFRDTRNHGHCCHDREGVFTIEAV